MGGFQIVKFLKENTVEVVPSLWITKENGQPLCLWPTSQLPNKIVAAIKNQDQPKSDWKKFHVEILSKHVYDTFAVASSKTNQATYTSCLESDEEEVCNNNCNEPGKRPRKKNKRYFESSSDKDFAQDSPSRTSIKIRIENSRSNFPTPPKIIKTQGLPQLTAAHQARVQVTKNLSKQLDVITKVPNKSATSGVPSANEWSTIKDNIPSVSSENQPNRANGIHFVLIVLKTDNLYASVLFLEYSQVIRLLHVINTRSQEQSTLLTTLLNRDAEHSSTRPRTTEPEDITFDIPTQNENTFLQLNARITESKEEKEALVNRLLHVGGNSAKDLIKRIMTKLVDDNVLKEYSWIGGKGKKKFGRLKMAEVIKDVCKLNREAKECSEKTIEGIISVYLSKATDRCNRKLKKQAGDQADEEVQLTENG